MKKTFTITVDIDTDREGISATDTRDMETGVYRIQINNDVHENPGAHNSVLPIVCHEIGHAIENSFFPDKAKQLEDAKGKDFDVIGREAMLYQILGIQIPISPETKVMQLADEKAAWAHGQKVFNAVKQFALKTYEDSTVRNDVHEDEKVAA